jgi:glycosyltransferase involved in cell wall biosynthesis
VDDLLMKKPKILYVTPCWPHAKPYGSQMRVLQIARTLKKIGELKLAIAQLPGDPDSQAERNTYDEFEVECATRLFRRSENGIAQRAWRCLNPRVVNPQGWVAEDHVKNHLLGRLERFDLIWLSYLRPANSFEWWTWPRSFMDIDDIPSTYERTLWLNGDRLSTRLRARWQMFLWQRRERLLSERFTVLGVSSEADRQYLAPYGGPVHLIPNRFERPACDPERRLTEPPRLGFIGTFGYAPNVDGVRWFIQECWPLIKRERPDVRLRLVGYGGHAALGSPGPDIDILGRVADASEEMATWWATIVPVRIGAGTRIKVLEAFSRKCPLVGTRIGVFGHDITHETEVLLADTPEDFAQSCLRLVRDPAFGVTMAERAWTRFLKEWTWEAGEPAVWAAVEDCLRRSGRTLTTHPGKAVRAAD